MATILPNGKTQFIDENGRPLIGGQVFYYQPNTETKIDTWEDADLTTPNPNPITLDARGQASIWGNTTYRQVVKDRHNTVVWDEIVSAAVSFSDLANGAGAALITYDNQSLVDIFSLHLNRVVESVAALRALSKVAYTRAFVTGYYRASDGGGGSYQLDPDDVASLDDGGTVIVANDGGRWKLQVTSTISVKQFGAKGGGVVDDAPAFSRARTAVPAGTRIAVPSDTYYLSSNPMAGNTKTVFWDIAVGATFKGPGAGVVGGFGTMFTNPYNVASGPYALFFDTVVPPAPVNNTNGVSWEIVSPAAGAYEQCLAYLGGDSNNNVTGNNVQCLLNLVQNVHKADLMPNVHGAGATIYKSLEIDVNVDVSAAGANSTNGVIGMLLTGGGAGGPYQGDAEYGIIFQRSTCNWRTAIDISASIFGLSIAAQNTPITIRTQYNAPPGSLLPSGKTGRGIYFDNAPNIYGPLLIGSQLSNGNDTIWLARNTDSAPTGAFLRGRDAANANDLIILGINGEITSYAPSSSNGSTNQAGGIQCNGLTLRGTTNLQLGNNYTPGAPAATGYLVVYDSSGRQCKLLCA
ncbi:hypothetical protein LGM75_27755 [Burkholderia multivorans]|uniref:hypothetical protein n=1 Tax=Burkholderia multivorans TaxID=87883 RepID=UPI001C22C63F|nr:hypothetical protein [Burkholderia multivorans]MBU9469114.1 hypothetical protein [Burkholderia multivorans]MCA8130152.1 hypothetical protein [Burkholderia multivorans]